MRDIDLDVSWSGLDEAFAELEKECAGIVRGVAIEAWNFILAQTPQYLGRMTASWSFSYERPIFVDRSHFIEQEPGEEVEDPETGERYVNVEVRHKGHPEAIDIANMFAAGKEAGFRLGMDIFFANGVDHGEGPYSADVESGSIRLRSVNRPGAPARRALDRITARYGEDISRRQAVVLRGLRIGGGE